MMQKRTDRLLIIGYCPRAEKGGRLPQTFAADMITAFGYRKIPAANGAYGGYNIGNIGETVGAHSLNKRISSSTYTAPWRKNQLTEIL